jgi:tetratricopeptide (TPR) repeat protein
MNEKAASVIQKAQQERKRGQFARALKRLEQGIAAHPDELDLYLEAIDTALDGGELMPATNLLKTVQEKFTRERDRVLQFVREKLQTVHDPSLARCVVDNAVKRRDLESALELLQGVPDHTIRELLNRARTKAQSLKSASAGGYALRGEAVSNELANALLSVRLGNLKEAMTTFVRLVEEKPIEHRALEPFLAALAARHAKSGRVRFARGCALRAGGNEVEAIQQFGEAARLEPACAAGCVEQLRAMLEKPHHPGKIRRALAEAQLLKGDFDDAAQTLREHLAENPDNAREVILLLRPFIDPANGLTACTWLAIEQAIGIEQSSLALDILRPLHQRGGHGAELLEWLEERSRTGVAPADVMMFHGALAIEQKRFERAAEILGAVCTTSAADVPAVLSIIDRHRGAHSALDALYTKHAPEDVPADSSSGDDGDFQTFESSEFHLEPTARAASAPESPAAQRPKPRFSSSPFSTSRDGTGRDAEAPRKSFIDANELTLDDDGAVRRAGGGSPVKTHETIEITEAHVTRVAQQLYAAGAAAFFHIDDGTGAEPAPASSTGMAGREAADPRPAAPAATAAAAAPEPFGVRFARFGRGELSNSDVLVLLEEAARDGLVDELHELLYFEPETSAEHFARYYYQAEYLVLHNRPLQALEILARLDTPDLESEQKLRVWYKIAIAQRMAQNYAGADATLERLIQHFPGRDELVRLKRRNHEQFIAEQSLAATTLEKTSSLD